MSAKVARVKRLVESMMVGWRSTEKRTCMGVKSILKIRRSTLFLLYLCLPPMLSIKASAFKAGPERKSKMKLSPSLLSRRYAPMSSLKANRDRLTVLGTRRKKVQKEKLYRHGTEAGVWSEVSQLPSLP